MTSMHRRRYDVVVVVIVAISSIRTQRDSHNFYARARISLLCENDIFRGSGSARVRHTIYGRRNAHESRLMVSAQHAKRDNIISVIFARRIFL